MRGSNATAAGAAGGSRPAIVPQLAVGRGQGLAGDVPRGAAAAADEHAPGFALLVLGQVLQALSERVPSRLLSAVLHLYLYLAKKQLVWLVHNSRPVMREPSLCRLQIIVVKERRMSRRERLHAVPPELSSQMLTLVCRWLLASWRLRYGEVWSGHWDEANAFCNPDCCGGPKELPPWLQRFYCTMKV